MVLKLDIPHGAVIFDQHGNKAHDFDEADIKASIQSAIDHQQKCIADAQFFLQFYFTESGAIETSNMAQWLSENQPLDRWFLIHLIEIAGQRFLTQSFSSHKSEIAKAKNAIPRAWCLAQWNDRPDKEQSKAAFSRQYAQLVKSHFDLNVTPDTIARDWLPKDKTTTQT